MPEYKKTKHYVYLVTTGCIPVTGFVLRKNMLRWLNETPRDKGKLTAYRIIDGQKPVELVMATLLKDAEHV